NVAFVQQPSLLRRVRPDSRETIRLELKVHGSRIRTARIRTHTPLDAQNILHVMPDLMRQHIGLSKLAWSSKPLLQLIVKTKIDVNLLVFRTIKRACRGLRRPTTRPRVIAK